MKKILLRLILLGLAAAATLVVLFYVWTDRAGARRWKAVEAELRAKGEPLTIAEIEPQPIAEELNFAAAPIFAEIAAVHDGKSWRISAINGFNGSWQKDMSRLAAAAREIDPAFVGSDEEAAKIVSNQTVKWKPLFDEIRAAAARPGTVWPSDFHDGFRMRISHVTVLIKVARALLSDARANLELGHSDAALADFQLIMNLALRSQEPPLVITYLVRQSITLMAADIVRDGLERHAWEPSALGIIQRELTGISLPASLSRALRVERVVFVDTMRQLSNRDVHDILALGDSPSKWPQHVFDTLWRFRPAGWLNEDRSEYAEVLQSAIAWLDHPTLARPESVDALDQLIQEMRSSVLAQQRNFFSLFSLPTLIQVIPKAFYAQAAIEEAQLACAIERSRLANGALPSELASLRPAYLSEMPMDPVGGKPFHYRVTGLDTYLLYSVGWNGLDDHGSDKKPSPKSFEESEDWVWKMPGVKP